MAKTTVIYVIVMLHAKIINNWPIFHGVIQKNNSGTVFFSETLCTTTTITTTTTTTTNVRDSVRAAAHTIWSI